MKCDDCGQRDAAPQRTKCWTCIKRGQRGKSQVQETKSKPERMPPVQTVEDPAPPEETYEQRLERRIKETGSSGAITIKVGYPPESAVDVPSKYEDQDLDAARAEIKEIRGIDWNVAKFGSRKSKV